MPEHRVLAEQEQIIHSAKVASYFRRSKEFGIRHDGFAIDMGDVRERKRMMVRGLNDIYMEKYRDTGAEFILGTGRFLAPRTVEVTLADGTHTATAGGECHREYGHACRVGDNFLALPKRSRSRISRLLSSMKFLSTCSWSVEATSEWRCPRRCAASGAR